MPTHENHPSPAQKGEIPTLSTSQSEEIAGGKSKSDEIKWQQMSEEGRQAALSTFFKRWVEPAEDRSKCLPEGELLLAAKEPDRTEWPTHLQDCARCRHIVEMGNPERVRIPINEILSESSRLAREVEQRSAKRSFTPWAYVTTFYKSLSPAQAAVLGLLLIVAVVGTIVPYSKRLLRPSNSLEAVVLPEDKFWATKEWFAKVDAIAEDNTLGPPEKIHRLQTFRAQEGQINRTIAELNQSVNDPQRAELGTLVANCQRQLKALSQSNGSANTHPEKVPDVAEIAASRIVTQVWEAFSSDKSDASDASKNIGVTSITTNGQVIVYDRVANRSEAEKKEIQDRLNHLQGLKVEVKRPPQEISSSPREGAAPPATAKVQ